MIYNFSGDFAQLIHANTPQDLTAENTPAVIPPNNLDGFYIYGFHPYFSPGRLWICPPLVDVPPQKRNQEKPPRDTEANADQGPNRVNGQGVDESIPADAEKNSASDGRPGDD